MRRSFAALGLLVSLLACDREPEALACGPQLQCTGGQICVEDRFDANCTNLDEGATCPQGQTQGMCGGAGLDCCCPPDPPSEYRCESASACEGEPSCACLGTICEDDKACGQLDEGSPLFACESLAAP